ncbi:exodeoxyribonuclease V subunit alpha [Desulfovibrionales bacterium]
MFAYSGLEPLLKSCGLFSLADIYQARCIAGLAMLAGRTPGDPELHWLILSTALVSRAVRNGHVCLDLESAETLAAFALLGQHCTLHVPISSSLARIVGYPGADTPLILSGSRLYLWRMFRDEQFVAQALLRLAQRRPDQIDVQTVANRLSATLNGAINWQFVACCSALRHALCIITGGPGTGKTTTVAAILHALRQMHGPDLRLGLAAPTGKAASRLSESLRNTEEHEGEAEAPVQAQTVHRLLGWRPGGTWRYHARNPLPVDVLVVDEVSMLDVELAARLLEALAPSARLVLLGDRHQLASVEAGALLANITGPDPVNQFSPCFSSWYATQSGLSLPQAPHIYPLTDRVVELQHSYRFDPKSGIAMLSTAIRTGRSEQVEQVLHADHPDLRVLRCTGEQELRAMLTAILIPAWKTLAHMHDPTDAFRVFDSLRLLSPVRQGPRGTETLNRLAREIMTGSRTAPAWYPGRPVLILENDYQTGLYNGDVGLSLPTPEGLRIFFSGHEGYQPLSPARLPRHETCYAMTVHKCQGSEFEHAILIVPEDSGTVLVRELFYTALTRAKQRFTLIGRVDQAMDAAKRPVHRTSGLENLLLRDQIPGLP